MKRNTLPKKKRKKIATRNSDKANDKVEDSYDKAEQKANNKKTHSDNGNKKMVVMQLNKGSSNFPTKSTLVMNEVKKFGPSIVNLCEANYKKCHRDVHGELVNYNIETSKQSEKLCHSRNILLVKKDVVYKRRKDLENNINSMIWIEVTLERSSILVMGA